MKTTTLFLTACLLAVLMAWSGQLNAQKRYRYVVTVETLKPQKTVEYYEIISPHLLTPKQCNELIRQGKARKLSQREKSKYLEYDLWNRKNMTMDGPEGINPWDAEQTEYDLMYEDPDLYDFIAD